MKRELELIENFFSDTKRGDKYRKTVSDLEKLGLREVLISLGNLPTEMRDNVTIENSAIKYAHLSGWMGCIKAIFNLDDFIVEKTKERAGSDLFSEARDKLMKDWGYDANANER